MSVEEKICNLDEVRKKRAELTDELGDFESVSYHPFSLEEDAVSVDELGVSVFLGDELGGVYTDVDTAERLGVMLIQAAKEKRLVDLGRLGFTEPEAG